MPILWSLHDHRFPSRWSRVLCLVIIGDTLLPAGVVEQLQVCVIEDVPEVRHIDHSSGSRGSRRGHRMGETGQAIWMWITGIGEGRRE